MTERSFIEKMRDVFYSLSRSSKLSPVLADTLIDLYISLSPSVHVWNGTVMTAREWATMVARDSAKMYNVEWSPTPEHLRDIPL